MQVEVPRVEVTEFEMRAAQVARIDENFDYGFDHGVEDHKPEFTKIRPKIEVIVSNIVLVNIDFHGKISFKIDKDTKEIFDVKISDDLEFNYPGYTYNNYNNKLKILSRSISGFDKMYNDIGLTHITVKFRKVRTYGEGGAYYDEFILVLDECFQCINTDNLDFTHIIVNRTKSARK